MAPPRVIGQDDSDSRHPAAHQSGEWIDQELLRAQQAAASLAHQIPADHDARWSQMFASLRGLSEAVASLTTAVSHLKGRVDTVQNSIPKDLDKKLAAIQQALANGDRQFALMEQQLNRLDDDVRQSRADLESRVKALEFAKAKADSDLAVLTNRVKTVESKMSNEETRLDRKAVPPQPNWLVQAAVVAGVNVIATATVIWWLQGIAQAAAAAGK